jgi:hypothetical protein
LVFTSKAIKPEIKNQNMTAQIHKILSRHATLSEAVAAAKIDLSYNEPLALRDLAYADKKYNITAAYVTEQNGEKNVHYELTCDIKLLNKYTPFHSCIDNSPFSRVEITDSEIMISKPMLSRSPKARAMIAQIGWTVTTR